MCIDDSIRTQQIQQAIAGDETALAALFQRYRARLRKMVLLRMDPRIRARVDASDVLQDAYVELARRLPNYVDDARLPFFLWLRTVAGDRLAQVHRTHLGAAMRDVNREVAIRPSTAPDVSTGFLAAQLVGQCTSVDRRAIQDELQIKLQEVLEAMDANDREVLALRHFEELSTEEISIVVGLSRSGVLKRYTRAVRRLQEALKGQPCFRQYVTT